MRPLFRSSTRQLCLSLLVTSILTGMGSISSPSATAYPWDAWKSWFGTLSARRRIGGISRGDAFCVVTPLPESAKVWSSQPVLVWQGSAAKVELIGADGKSYPVSEAMPLSAVAALTPTTYSATVTQLVAPGQYQWRVQTGFSEPRLIDFEVITDPERQQVTEALDQLQQTGIADEAAAQRADYFAGENLWSDFWQTALSVSPPSQDWQNVNSNTIAALCPILDASDSLPSTFSKSTESGSVYLEHTFMAEAGQSIEVTLESAEITPRVYIFDPQGNRVNLGENVRVFTLSEAGRYTVRVLSDEPQRGQYHLTVISRYGLN